MNEEITVESLEKKCKELLEKCAELEKNIQDNFNPFLDN